MRKFFVNLWTGEPVRVFGLFNVIVVALIPVVGVQWFNIVAIVVTAISTELARRQVSPAN